jgi:hypothetical protein
MSDAKKDKDGKFLDDLEKGILKVMRAAKSTNEQKIAAINAGVRLAAIRHKVTEGDTEAGFFGQ